MSIKQRYERWLMKHLFRKYDYLYKSHDITSKWIARSTKFN